MRPAIDDRYKPGPTRSRAISGCQVTSTKWTAETSAWRNFGLGLSDVPSDLPLPVTRRQVGAAKQNPRTGPPWRHRPPFTKTRPPSNANSSALRFSKGDPGVVVAMVSSDLIALVGRLANTAGTHRPGHHRTTRDWACRKRRIA